MPERILARCRLSISGVGVVLSATETGVFYEADANGVSYCYFRAKEIDKIKHVFGNIAGNPRGYILTYKITNEIKDYFEGLKRRDGKREAT